jgi:hypothetical protein
MFACTIKRISPNQWEIYRLDSHAEPILATITRHSRRKYTATFAAGAVLSPEVMRSVASFMREAWPLIGMSIATDKVEEAA